MSVYWKIFTDAGNQDKALKVAKSAIKSVGVSQIDIVVEQYHKGGFSCSFETLTESSNWSDVVVSTIQLAQNIGRAYIISGSINNELEMWSNDPSVSGVTHIQVMAIKNA